MVQVSANITNKRGVGELCGGVGHDKIVMTWYPSAGIERVDSLMDNETYVSLPGLYESSIVMCQPHRMNDYIVNVVNQSYGFTIDSTTMDGLGDELVLLLERIEQLIVMDGCRRWFRQHKIPFIMNNDVFTTNMSSEVMCCLLYWDTLTTSLKEIVDRVKSRGSDSGRNVFLFQSRHPWTIKLLDDKTTYQCNVCFGFDVVYSLNKLMHDK